MPKRVEHWLAFLTAAVMLCCLGTFGQVQTGEILGVVTDSSGAAVPAATVTITDTDTGVAREVKTDDQGRYDVSDLNIGNYQVQAQMQGFATQAQKGLVLAVGQKNVTDFKLEVGAVTQEVTVSSTAAPQVNTTTSEVGGLINQDQMTDLPLNGRNYEELYSLVPGVQQIQAVNNSGNDNGSSIKFSVAGTRSSAGSVLLDGVEIRSYWGQGGGSQVLSTSLGIDGIAEFQTLTSSFNAQYHGVSVISQVTRSGTNSFHGSAYGFFRNSDLNTRNYFDPTSGPPPSHYNQFGGSLGGPIKKNKAFFFANYEGLRDALTLYATEQVPNHNAQLGYLPCALAPNVTCNTVNGVQLANVNVSPKMAPYMALFPDFSSGPVGPITGLPANVTNQASAGTVQAVVPGQPQQHENFFAGKLDYQVAAADNIMFRYVIDKAFAANPWTNGGNSTLVPLAITHETEPERNEYMTVQERHIFSSDLINVASFNVALTNYTDNDTYSGTNAANIESLMTFIQDTPTRPLGNITVAGTGEIYGSSQYDPFRFRMNTFVPQDEIDWVHGAHTFKFGGDVVRLQCNCGVNSSPGGTYAFAASGVTGVAPYSGLESLLTGVPLKFTGAVPGLNRFRHEARQIMFSAYFQDDWKVTKNLTLNLGIRDDFTTNPVDALNAIYKSTCVLCGYPLTLVPRAFENNPSTRNIDPRIGFAWDIFGDHKTSLRAGYGIFHSVLYPRDYLTGWTFGYPNASGAQLNPSFPNPLSGGWGTATISSNGNTTPWNQCCIPYFQEYNLQIERQLAGGLTATVGYVGSRGVHLVENQNVNNTQPTSILANGTQYRATNNNPRPDQNFNAIVEVTPEGSSNYNGLTATVKRSSHNLEFQSSFTWSRCIDWGSSVYGGGWDVANDQSFYITPQLPGAMNKGPCSFDVNKNWTTSAFLPLPFHRNQLVEGWQIGIIATAKTGNPSTPVVSTAYDVSNIGSNYFSAGTEAPNRNPNFTGPLIVGKPTEWFNPNAYMLPPVGDTGAFGLRNSIPGPNIVDADVALMKDTNIKKLGESAAVELRADIFNVFNHTDFQLPNATIFTGPTGLNGSAGVISNTSVSSRQMQFSARFRF